MSGDHKRRGSTNGALRRDSRSRLVFVSCSSELDHRELRPPLEGEDFDLGPAALSLPLAAPQAGSIGGLDDRPTVSGNLATEPWCGRWSWYHRR